jgi:hypothetical protein
MSDTETVRCSKVRRSWAVLRLIAASRHGLTVQQVVEAIGGSDRNIRRDLETLLELDIGVERIVFPGNKPDRFRAKNYVVLAPGAARAKYCGGCGDPIVSDAWFCSEPCRASAKARHEALAKKYGPARTDRLLWR